MSGIARRSLLGTALALSSALPIQAQVSGSPNAPKLPMVYSPTERAAAFQNSLHGAAAPVLGTPTSVEPNAPYAADGTHLSFWKPSFVLGTADGGQAGVNFYGLHNQGHINIGFTAKPVKSYALDCRFVATGNITYKIYAGSGGAQAGEGEVPLNADGHFLLLVPISAPNELVSVELWPTPIDAMIRFLGCDLSTAE